jgi:hypothetical protein
VILIQNVFGSKLQEKMIEVAKDRNRNREKEREKNVAIFIIIIPNKKLTDDIQKNFISQKSVSNFSFVS